MIKSNLLSEFAKVTNDKPEEKTEQVLYGTIGSDNTIILDGSPTSTPMITTMKTDPGERVTCIIKNNKLIVTGNLTNEAIRTSDSESIAGDAVSVVADTLNANYARLDFANITDAYIESLFAKTATTDYLDAHYASIDNLETLQAIIDNLDVIQASIDNLDAAYASISNLDSTYAKITDMAATYATIENLNANYTNTIQLRANYATIENLNAINSQIETLSTSIINTATLNANYAQIDFANITDASIQKLFSDSGIIDDLVMQDGRVTGELVGVTISGDLIKANTLVANKLVVLGSNGLYYKINTDGIKTEAQQTDYNSLNGSIIKAKSIVATKINVSDLQAFGATIGGFAITNSAIYSGIKSSASNTTRGVFLGKDAQIAVGDASNYVRYIKDINGDYSLEIAANSIKLGTANVASTDLINNLEIGGRNYFSNKVQVGSGTTNFNTENEFTLGTYQNVGSFSQFYNLVVPMSYFVGKKVRLSFDCISPNGTTAISVYNNNSYSRYRISSSGLVTPIGDSWTHQDLILNVSDLGTAYSEAASNKIEIYCASKIGVKVKNVKLEIGDKSTDWTPAVEDIDDKIEATEESISLLDGRITSNALETTSLGTRMSTVEQTANGLTLRLTTTENNVSTAQSTANTANNNAINSAKTATNYLRTDSSGLLVGNLTGTLGENILIKTNGIDIRDNTTVLASFSSNLIELGKNSTSSIIQLCGNKGVISYDDGYLNIRGQDLRLFADHMASLYSYFSSGSSGYKSAVNVSTDLIDMYCQDSTNLIDGVGVWRTSQFQVSAPKVYCLTDKIELYGRYGIDIGTVSGNVNIDTTNVKSTRSLRVLWTGAQYMFSGQNANLSEPVSDQLTGIVLHWQQYSSGSAQNAHHVYTFVPKSHVVLSPGGGVSCFLTNATGAYVGTKYIYVNNNSLAGHEANDDNTTNVDSGITTKNNFWVLTQVLGV